MSPLPRRIRRVIARRGQIEDKGARAQRRLLQDLRRDVLAELAQATGYRQWHLSQLLSAINQHIARGKAAAEIAAGAAVRQSWQAGIQLADAVLDSGALTGLSDPLLNAIIDVTQDQTRAVWSELGSKLKTTVRRATVGVVDPFKAMVDLSKAISDPKIFKSPMARAEVIVRTEVNRTFSVAQQQRLGDAAAAMKKVGLQPMKYWLSAEDDRVRPEHAAAASRYSKEKAIPVDQPFVVGGEKLMHPVDPAGSAWNTIQCRCVSVPVVGEMPEPEPESLGPSRESLPDAPIFVGNLF